MCVCMYMRACACIYICDPLRKNPAKVGNSNLALDHLKEINPFLPEILISLKSIFSGINCNIFKLKKTALKL